MPKWRTAFASDKRETMFLCRIEFDLRNTFSGRLALIFLPPIRDCYWQKINLYFDLFTKTRTVIADITEPMAFRCYFRKLSILSSDNNRLCCRKRVKYEVDLCAKLEWLFYWWWWWRWRRRWLMALMLDNNNMCELPECCCANAK